MSGAVYVATVEVSSEADRDNDLYVAVCSSRVAALEMVLDKVREFSMQDDDYGFRSADDQGHGAGLAINLNGDLEAEYDAYRMAMHWYVPSVWMRPMDGEMIEHADDVSVHDPRVTL